VLLVQRPSTVPGTLGAGGRAEGDVDAHALAEELVRQLGNVSSSLRANSVCSKVSAVDYVPTTDLRRLREETIVAFRRMMMPAHWISAPGASSPAGGLANGATAVPAAGFQTSSFTRPAQTSPQLQDKHLRTLREAGVAAPEGVAAGGSGGSNVRVESSDSGGVEGVMTTNTSPRVSPRNIGLGPLLYGAGNSEPAALAANVRSPQALAEGGSNTPLSRPPLHPMMTSNGSPLGGAGAGSGSMPPPEKRPQALLPKLPLAALNEGLAEPSSGSGGVGGGYSAANAAQSPWRIVGGEAYASYATQQAGGGGGDGRRSPSAQMYKAMTPRTEIRRHMQGKSTAKSVRRQQASPSLFGSHGPSPRAEGWVQMTPASAAARAGDASASRAQRSSSPSLGDAASQPSAHTPSSSEMKAWMDPSVTPASKRKVPPSVLGSGQRGTWVASSAGGARMKYEDKKVGFLTGVETGVTAMRGAAGWYVGCRLAPALDAARARCPRPLTVDQLTQPPCRRACQLTWVAASARAPAARAGSDAARQYYPTHQL
jgi:hypothetical protein